MAKNRAYDIAKDYRATGNKVMDTVASILIWHQNRKIPLKSISIKEPYYGRFKQEVEKLQGHPLEDEQPLSFNSVNIERGSFLQRSIMLVEKWPVSKPLIHLN